MRFSRSCRSAQSGIAFSADVPATMRDLIMQQKAAAAPGTVGALAVLLIALAGLANMLLVSVHTEIRETGVRRALGATAVDVIWHFLSEGTLLSAAGVVAGVLLGILACWLTKTQVGLPVSVSGFWICAAAVAVITAGTLISLVPALIAAAPERRHCTSVVRRASLSWASRDGRPRTIPVCGRSPQCRMVSGRLREARNQRDS